MAKLDEYKQFLSNNEMYLYRLEHNTFVVESMKLLYMDTPKTAGTSLKTKLAETVADYIPPDHSDSLETVPEMFIHDRVINPLKPVTFYSEEEQNEILFQIASSPSILEIFKHFQLKKAIKIYRLKLRGAKS